MSGKSARRSTYADLTQLTGATYADNMRHVIVRSTFMDEFAGSEGMQIVSAVWTVEFGLADHVNALVAVLDRLSTAVGARSRNEIQGYLHQLPPTRESQALIDETLASFDVLERQMRAVDHDQLHDSARDLVLQIGLPWPWLAIELIEYWIDGLASLIYEQQFWKSYHYEPVRVRAPRACHDFRTSGRESLERALMRLDGEFANFRRQLEQGANSLPRGRLPLNLLEEQKNGVGRYGRWLFRSAVKGESINSIARSAACDRKTVRYGIGEAKRLLGLTTLTY